ncbi:TPA: Clp protease ClpP, partial [Staphylococcus aureus]|nr:Clp protease ClpP [Staphylococcus aureus]HBI9167955.1 Clp protease ClpP [Staphylococcus aureus]HBI9262812.1 Clp protease ClpP [Staphylococcus aureus]HDE3151006.1 Clp protease ClpP [Staphylococcus aureus]HDE9079418.1 Clp protease ClpP [Staphylococcus aureus]
YKRFENVPEDLKKDVDKITKIDDVDTSELVETPKESMSLEEKEKREKIKRECEILKMTMSY